MQCFPTHRFSLGMPTSYINVHRLHYGIHTVHLSSCEVHVSEGVFPLEEWAAAEGRVFYWTCEHCFLRSLELALSCRSNLSLAPGFSGAQALLTPPKRTVPSLYYIKVELGQKEIFHLSVFSSWYWNSLLLTQSTSNSAESEMLHSFSSLK